MPVTLFNAGSSSWGSFVWGVDPLGGSSYSLPSTLIFRADEQEMRLDTNTLAFADGAKTTGEELKDRRVSVEGMVASATRAAQLDLLDEIKYQIHRPNLRLTFDDGRYINLTKCRKFEADPEEITGRKIHNVRIEWQVDDPFWYATAEETRTFTVLGNTSFSVDALTGLKKCMRGQSPLITVTSTPLGSLPTFTLANSSDGGLQFRYSDPDLTLGQAVKIDCRAGTVTRGGANTIRYFEGEFMRLLAADTLVYTGQPATIQFTWQHRWI